MSLKKEKQRSKFGHVLWVVAGTLALSLGLLGIVLPILPTTPFFLLASGCYLRSSERLYHRWLSSRLYQKYMNKLIEQNGHLTLRAKLFILVPVWGMLLFLILFVFSSSPVWQGVCFGLGVLKIIVMFRVKILQP